jgi:hypothetical protein
MKKLLYTLAIILTFAACQKDEILKDKGQLNPDAVILIKPAKGVQLKSAVIGLTATEIVEMAANIKWQTHYSDNVYSEKALSIARGFNEQQKDFEIPALKMFGIDVITQEGEYRKDFTHAFNVVITDNISNDTIAYVPDDVINAARPLIEAAYDNEDYTEVYRLFDEAFTFLPIAE